MRHRWMVMLVVMVTTITTAQEALKQYDGLKARAEEWATLRLWTGFINAYTPQDESPEAQAATCPVISQATVEHMSRQDAPAQQAQSIATQLTGGQRYEAANMHTSVEALAIEDEQHNDAVEAPDSEFEHMGEVALLAEPSVVTPEDTSARVRERAEQVSPSDDSPEEISNVRALPRVRLISRALNQDLAGPAPLAAAEEDAVLRQARIASRAEAKAKAIRRAIRVIQIQLERSRKVELRADGRDSGVETPNAIETALPAPAGTISIAADYPVAPQALIMLRAPTSISGERTTGE